MALPVVAVVLIKVVAAALAVFLATYLLSAAVRLIFNAASAGVEALGGVLNAASAGVEALGGVQNVVLIGGIAYLAINGGFVRL